MKYQYKLILVISVILVSLCQCSVESESELREKDRINEFHNKHHNKTVVNDKEALVAIDQVVQDENLRKVHHKRKENTTEEDINQVESVEGKEDETLSMRKQEHGHHESHNRTKENIVLPVKADVNDHIEEESMNFREKKKGNHHEQQQDKQENKNEALDKNSEIEMEQTEGKLNLTSSKHNDKELESRHNKNRNKTEKVKEVTITIITETVKERETVEMKQKHKDQDSNKDEEKENEDGTQGECNNENCEVVQHRDSQRKRKDSSKPKPTTTTQNEEVKILREKHNDHKHKIEESSNNTTAKHSEIEDKAEINLRQKQQHHKHSENKTTTSYSDKLEEDKETNLRQKHGNTKHANAEDTTKSTHADKVKEDENNPILNKLIIQATETNTVNLKQTTNMLQVKCFDSCVEKCFKNYEGNDSEIKNCADKACKCDKDDISTIFAIKLENKTKTWFGLMIDSLIIVSLLSLTFSLIVIAATVFKKRENASSKYENQYDSINLNFSQDLCEDKMIDQRIFESNYELMTTEIDDVEEKEICIRDF